MIPPVCMTLCLNGNVCITGLWLKCVRLGPGDQGRGAGEPVPGQTGPGADDL